MLLPYVVSAHIKDYTVEKAECVYIINGAVLGTGQSDTDTIIKKLMTKKDSLREFMIETSILRRKDATKAEVIEDEVRCIAESRDALRRYIAKYGG